MKNPRLILNPLSPQAAGRATVAALVLVLLLCVLLTPQTAWANPPGLMAYQGYVVDASGTALATNTPRNFDVIFRIYPLQQGGTSVWAEQQTVTVDKGYFSVLLGQGAKVGAEPGPPDAISAVFAHAPTALRYIGITVKIPGQADVEIAPRLQLITSPYAFAARNAAGLISPNGSNLVTAANGQLTVNGTLGATTINAAGLTGLTASQIPDMDASKITTGTLDARLSANVALLNRTPQAFTGTNTFAGYVGIGTTTPTAKLQIGGNASFFGNPPLALQATGAKANATVTGAFAIGTSDASNPFGVGVRLHGSPTPANRTVHFQTGEIDLNDGGNIAFQAQGGNVGIGTITPSAKLDVTANARVRGTIRTGSELGSSQAPNPAGLVIRRVNSTVSTANQVVARTDLLTLERDGSISGLLIRYPANVNKQTVMVRYMNGDNNSYSYYARLDSSLVGAAAGTYPLNSLFPGNVINWEITFGDLTYSGSGHYTHVHLTRYYADVDVAANPAVRNWIGTVTSTFDQ